ncbi:putative toxin-antitoxin system toxin component, PIN family [Rubrivirga sp. S365]|uniref:Toxin-antitoxin system toxin component, PIN family n=1 Tax=Rubrivirga litoralis TaxID=3075598 RepID=A0ABU3BND0_9BACT|nr:MULTISPECIES: putative toxin-antitoxin system toxin component, PIN family [unclassified Rubrivirga]MDT0630789.1 putative toxin-antitoxin system toxin component, PIN family [Rubrivirga sp. F394]MDT7856459.1 putative toxin-antitoxin system toxin component, PIN family [Rubrivirga sp. S365]
MVDWIIDHGRLLASTKTLAEFSSRFIQRKKFDRYLRPEGRELFTLQITDAAELVAVTTRLAVCADPDDDRFLELAVDGRADCVVTGNTRDFPAAHGGVPVLTPAHFAGRYLDA